MMRRRAVRILCVFVGILLLGGTARAQDPAREELCRATLLKVVVPAQAADAKATPVPCQRLAILVFTSITTPVADVILRPDATNVASIFSQRDLQARHSQQAALGGTPAQGEAVPGVQPAGVAAGTIAAVGTEAGTDAIAALTLNPVMLFLTDLATEAAAKYSRFLDLTMFVPVSAAETEDTTGSRDLKYFGARLRVNILGLGAGDEVWREAERLFLQLSQKNALLVDHILQVLRQAPTLDACVTALTAPLLEGAAILKACGQPVRVELDLTLADTLRRNLAAVRHAADARYFGADVRVDVGDPTLGGVENAKGSFLFAGVAYGQRFLRAAQSGATGFRARLGGRYAKLNAVEKAEFAAEGGLGFDVTRQMNDTQEINASAALEFRRGSTADALIDEFETNFGMIRGSLVVPVAAANSLSLNFGVPLWGEASPILSVNFNWGMLLSQVLARNP
jgi:hypothetical protein